MKTVAVLLIAALTSAASAESSMNVFASIAMKIGGAIVGTCPTAGLLTKDEVMASGVEQNIYKVTTQVKINGSKASAYIVNPKIEPATRGCIYKLQKIDVTKSGSLTIKNK